MPRLPPKGPSAAPSLAGQELPSAPLSNNLKKLPDFITLFLSIRRERKKEKTILPLKKSSPIHHLIAAPPKKKPLKGLS